MFKIYSEMGTAPLQQQVPALPIIQGSDQRTPAQREKPAQKESTGPQ